MALQLIEYEHGKGATQCIQCVILAVDKEGLKGIESYLLFRNVYFLSIDAINRLLRRKIGLDLNMCAKLFFHNNLMQPHN